MADNYWLTGPQGSVFNLGSYLVADPGPDFGTHDLLRAAYGQNSLTEGGEFAFESVGVRQFKFPLLLASAAAIPSGLTGAESWLRTLARPGGAFVDVMPEGVATGDMVRFDVLTGRWEPDYSVFVNRVGRRQGNLILDVQPLGYLPTMMILASTASVRLPGQVALSAVPGDYPAQAEVVVQPQAPATQYFTGASFVTDGLAWGLTGQPSFVPLLSAASWLNPQGSILAGSAFGSPDGWFASAVSDIVNSAAATWYVNHTYQLTSDLEPAYRGRFGVYGWLRWPQSATGPTAPVNVLCDAVAEPGAANFPMASSNVVATLPLIAGAPLGGTSGGDGLFSVLPLGQISLPPAASGVPQSLRLRVWTRVTPFSLGINHPEFAGLFLQPLHSAGVLPNGIQAPTSFVAGDLPGRFVADAVGGRALVAAATGALSSQVAYGDAVAYRGALPRAGASTLSLNVLGLARPGRTFLYPWEVFADQPDYFFRLNDASTTRLINWGTNKVGSWVQSATAGWGPGHPSINPYLPANADGGYYSFQNDGSASHLAVASMDLSNRSFTVEVWARDRRSAGGGSTLANILAWGGSHTAQQHLQIGWSATNTTFFGLGPADQLGATLTADVENTIFRHMVGVVDATQKYMAFYRDGTVVGSKAIATTLRQSGTLMFIGKDSLGAASGMINAWVGDVAVYLDTALNPSRIAAHYGAAVSYMGPSQGLYAEGFPQAAAVSVRARPRFQFLRGI
jgi:hypothetical protein